ncbi:hypothetical protein HBI32_202510 [Parastagonospora nodorum]|nr:hypothetical protein HBI32_202510 [Parastagonospora nodorum]KAH6197329.1 hypothetical protein HBI15_207950 [Parastagonospora nodorum]
MDARQAAFQRPPDRPMIHNPNHQPSPQTYTGYAPPTPQPQQPQQPLHVPFSQDPYAAARRDPFLPTTAQHVRRSSQGISGGDNAPQPQAERQGGWTHTARPNHGIHYGAQHHHSQTGPPPPPSMSASNNPPAPSQYGFDAARRNSLNGGSPPAPYGAPPHDTPAPPSFARPHMPPPSSPQQHHASQPQRAPYASNFGANRELPGLGSAHRPGSSMSISSLIGGGDAGAPAQTSQSQPSPVTNAQSVAGHSMQPPSPRRGLPPGPRSDFAPFPRQPSPDRSMYGGNASRAPGGQNFSAGSPSRSYSNQGSPELGRQSLPPSNQTYKFLGQRLYGQASNDAVARDHQQAAANVPPRPNSQPTGPLAARDIGRPPYDAMAGRRSAYGPPEERRRTLGESHHARPNTAELLGIASQGPTARDRPTTVQPVSQSAFSPPRDQHTMPGPNDPPRGVWRHSAPVDAPRDAIDSRREDPAASQRPYGPYHSPSHAPSRFDGQSGETMAQQRSMDRMNNRVVEQYHAAPTSDPNSIDRQKTEPLARSLSSRSLYEYPRRMGEEMQHSKSHIGFGLEASRRTGRASPLPQAVQGAQAQPMSIGKDPGIKSEFGRMFSGLGSGLGSSTPSRGSPLPHNGQGPFAQDPESGDMMMRLQRVNSQQGRKSKRVKDEDVFDADSNDGRGTPSGVRGAKRNKYTHAGHHHHHVPHHHHHHHHHKPDDELLQSNTSTPLNGRQGSLPQNGPGQPVHHHHHIQGTPHHHHHHHHHAPRGGPQGPSPVTKMPIKVHDIQPVLDEAAKFPRRHLGSRLYETTTELPKPNSSLDDQFGYASKPKRLPRFEVNPINCTFTIRVPRFFLKPRQRQHIVLERHLWGARVYRDDSDPIAAAIHSGWIRGEWDETVDVTMLDPRITAPNDAKDADDILTKPPAAPVTPPTDMDLQIEILILPQLQEYEGTVEYGISSKKGKAHEGLSFMINKVKWVEEAFGSRGQERTAAALKRRLDAGASLLALKSGFDDTHRANGMAQLLV